MFGFIPFASLFASLGQAKLNATPSLTRRFSLLQSSAGDTSVEGLKEGFAEQRSRGAANAITEEEEDLVLDALKKMRTDWSTGAASSDEDDVVGALQTLSGTRKSSGQSQFSTQSDVSSTTPSSPMNGDGSSRTSKREKRYTNNVFGSGQFRDRTYLRSVPRQNSSRSMLSNDSRRGNSSANTSLYSNSPSVRPMTPEMHSATSAPSSPNGSNGSREELGTSTRSAPLAAPYPYTTTPTSVAAYRLSKTFASSALPRVAASLDEVVSQLEEAGDDQVLVPRISQLHKPMALASSGSSSSGQTSGQVSSEPTPDTTSGIAISADRPISADDAIGRVASPIPRSETTSPRLPGYIPGMPRPMTPRNIDLHDELRSHSTTPRATPPHIGSNVPQIPPSLVHRGSDASNRPASRPESPAIKSPSFVYRANRFNPDADGSFENDPPTRRRPTSPLAGQSFVGASISRPTTPSRITWNANRNGSSSGHSVYSHSRNNSLASMQSTGASLQSHGESRNGDHALDRARSLRSPALPESPLVDATLANGGMASYANVGRMINRPPSEMSGFELGASSPRDSPSFRSETPVRTPGSPGPSSSSIGINVRKRLSLKHSSTSSIPFSLALGSPQSTTFGGFDNSSRSSLASDGSSYHSDGDNKQETGLHQLLGAIQGASPAAWHESPVKEREMQEAEAVVKQMAGLNMQDFLAIQERLLEATRAKAPTETVRTPSLRRRRPSVSRSMHSLSEKESQMQMASAAERADIQNATSPPPTEKPIPANGYFQPTITPTLNVPVDLAPERAATPSIQVKVETSVLQVPAGEERGPSSPDRRNRDLARALFGGPSTENVAVVKDDSPRPSVPRLPNGTSPHLSPQPSHGQLSPAPQSPTPGSVPSSKVSVTSKSSSPSLRLDSDPAALAIDVQRRAEAATLALRKSPSATKLNENGMLHRKPINTKNIGTPKLEYASTSIEALPLQSPSLNTPIANSPKAGKGFFKFGRGSIRHKPISVPYDDHPHQGNGYSTNGSSTPLSATPVKQQSPPGSGGPAKKSGFMSRFRKAKPTEPSVQELDYTQGALPSVPMTATGPAVFMQPPGTPAHHVAQSAPALSHAIFTGMPRQMQEMSPTDPEPPIVLPSSTPPADTSITTPTQPTHQSAPSQDEQALQQLYDAASNLGLDQATLNAILARSSSVKSTSTLSSSRFMNASAKSTEPLSVGRPSTDLSAIPKVISQEDVDAYRARSPLLSEGRPSFDTSFQFRGPPPTSGGRKVLTPTSPEFGGRLSLDASDDRDETIMPNRRPIPKRLATSDSQRSREDAAASQSKRSTVVRRTIIFSSDPRLSTMDFNALVNRMPSTKQKRRSSAQSVQSGRGSLVERVPTPPPARAGGNRRFSSELAPPVPRLPMGLGVQGDTLPPMPTSAPPGKVSYGQSYESMYDVFSDDVQHPAESPVMGHESRPAIEVIEMANGETVWSVVNGLREDEEDDTFDSRLSFVSETSADQDNDGVQLFFKEHGRNASKGSNQSFLTRAHKKPRQQQGGLRPDTKVFYSSPDQIARIIEDLSRGMDSGAFNIMPSPSKPSRGHTSTHSATSATSVPSSFQSSDGGWTVEERLDRMLGSINQS